MYELYAVLIIVFLVLKELTSAVLSRDSQKSSLFYVPVVPLLVLYGIKANTEISRIPSLWN